MDTKTPKATEASQAPSGVDHEEQILHQHDLEIPDVTWYKDPGLRKLYLMIPFLFLGSTINGYDGSLLNGLQTLKPWQEYFDHPTGARIGLFTAMQNVGAIAAMPFSAYVADAFGRRMGVTIGLVVLFVGVILQVVPGVNSNMFIGGRFLVGLGSNLAQGSAPLLIMEVSHPQHRGKLTTMYNTLWYVGAIIAAWTVFGMVDYTSDVSWILPTSLQALMPLVQLIGVWFLPESPRWLCSKGRFDDAFGVLSKYHANGNRNDAFVQKEFHEIQETIKRETQNSRDTEWMTLLRTPGNRKRVLLIILVSFYSQASGNGLVSFYIKDILVSVGITEPHDQSLINGGVQIWSFLVAICFSVFLVDRFGRKKLFMIAGVGMLIAFSVWTGCSAVYAQTKNPAAGNAVIAMIFLFYGAAGFAWPGLTVAYCAEILPYNIRAKGVALQFAATSITSVAKNYINPIGLRELQWKFYFVYIGILIVECISIWFLFVETKGPTLEEIAVLFDGEAAAVANIEESDIGMEKDEASKAERIVSK
ncbi:general substrate transporter [Aaosphaeria arxii CBS 175.79]|uniref:General substrate transporter n=1 Tax=Aaosphaeria arxii CBS 175.79 TaxID=1450172 RepID=A0A6A5YAJ9_9PLEO|nr:general substrate transporter [Aaosphaeria arxii CBS 175.79]KAF2022379.1 general substrate transporter [Aaosphaeria arxii CBS 175.79]